MCKNIFVTGTDTGVGKTIVSAYLRDKLKKICILQTYSMWTECKWT